MRVSVCVGALAVILVGSAASGAMVEEFTVQDWSGLAVRDEATGRLASCAIYSKFQNGATLFLIKHVDGGWALSLAHGAWSLKEHESYPVRYRVDREPFVADVSTALGPDQIGVTLADDDPLIEQIRRGRLLTVQFEGREYGFELSNSGKAVQAAKECLERRREPTGPQIAVDESALMPPPPPPAEEPAPVLTAPAGVAQMQEAARAETPPPDQRQVIGPWVVAVTRDDSGRFMNCTAFNVRGGDQLLLSHYPDEFWDVSLYRPSWALQTDAGYQLRYKIDGPLDAPGAVRRSAEALEPTRIGFEATGAEGLLARMEQGREIEFEVEGGSLGPQVLSFRLERAAEAFAAARECTRRNVHGI